MQYSDKHADGDPNSNADPAFMRSAWELGDGS
jgi:hypothetical protein